jgi:hypothetical protein
MSVDHDHTGTEEASAAWNRSYYVPDPPKMPDPPGSTSTTAPADPGYTGPRHLRVRGGITESSLIAVFGGEDGKRLTVPWWALVGRQRDRC